MQAKEAIRKPPVTIAPGATVAEAAERMDREVVGALVVVEGDQPVGIVTDRDLVVRALARRLPNDARIDSVMTTELVTLPADADIRDVLAAFYSHRFRRLPLVEDGRMAGMVTVDDLMVGLVDGLGLLIRPVFGQVVFGTPEPQFPVPVS
jgi:CBS domain-containing protein